MKAGIIGLASSGKTTLTGAFMGTSRKSKGIGIVQVPDERLFELEKIYSPEKTTPATVQIEDLPSLDTQIKEEKVKFFEKGKTMDVQILCTGAYRCYSTEDIIKEKNLIQVSDEGALTEIVKKVLEANPNSIIEFKNGMSLISPKKPIFIMHPDSIADAGVGATG